MVLDMQARLLLDMLGKGIESALVNPSALVFEPWRVDGETITGINPEAMAVDPALVSSIQAYVDAVLDLASHFITRLRRYASFCRTLASHAASAGTGSNRNNVTSPTQNASSPATPQGQYTIDFVIPNLLQHDNKGFEWYIATKNFIPLSFGDDTKHLFGPRFIEYEMSFLSLDILHLCEL
jgi:hypothetical protein